MQPYLLPLSSTLQAALLERCRAALPLAAVPTALLVLPRALPRSAAGKIDRSALPEPDWATAAAGPGDLLEG